MGFVYKNYLHFFFVILLITIIEAIKRTIAVAHMIVQQRTPPRVAQRPATR